MRDRDPDTGMCDACAPTSCERCLADIAHDEECDYCEECSATLCADKHIDRVLGVPVCSPDCKRMLGRDLEAPPRQPWCGECQSEAHEGSCRTDKCATCNEAMLAGKLGFRQARGVYVPECATCREARQGGAPMGLAESAPLTSVVARFERTFGKAVAA